MPQVNTPKEGLGWRSAARTISKKGVAEAWPVAARRQLAEAQDRFQAFDLPLALGVPGQAVGGAACVSLCDLRGDTVAGLRREPGEVPFEDRLVVLLSLGRERSHHLPFVTGAHARDQVELVLVESLHQGECPLAVLEPGDRVPAIDRAITGNDIAIVTFTKPSTKREVDRVSAPELVEVQKHPASRTGQRVGEMMSGDHHCSTLSGQGSSSVVHRVRSRHRCVVGRPLLHAHVHVDLGDDDLAHDLARQGPRTAHLP